MPASNHGGQLHFWVTENCCSPGDGKRVICPALPLIYCLLFGALISPTDPVAVLGIPFGLLGQQLLFRKNTVKTLTWGGLRGGIAVALALSIPQVPQRHMIVFTTYMVVVLSIVVQGLTIKKMLRRWGM